VLVINDNANVMTCISDLSLFVSGKRPRDLLNPKAVKYMQSVFSIKDAISKKESREISALFGVTVTQVIVCLMFTEINVFSCRKFLLINELIL